MKKLIFLILLSVSQLFAAAQCDQVNFDKLVKEGDQLAKQEKYREAVNKYSAAMIMCPDKNMEAQKRIVAVFDKINLLKIKAEQSEKNAIEEKAKAQKLVDAFYFYDGKFALAYNNGEFYFIDKNGDAVEKLGKWKSAGQFDDRGFAKVNNWEENNFLLDTMGNFYRIAYTIEDLNSEVTALDFNEKELDSIPSEVFKNTQLKLLFLSGNSIKYLSPQIGELTNLISLEMSGNELTSIPSEFGKLTNLITLDLGGNELTSIPPEIGELTNLTSLNLYNNNLTHLPSQIGELKNLTFLSIGNNLLTTLPSDIGKLSNLTFLNLEYNNLVSLPMEIGNWVHLTYLRLEYNRLTALPAEIGNLTNLSSLRLGYNQLSALPAEIGKLTNLSSINLTENKLTTLPSEIGNLSKLTSLSLGSIPLKTTPLFIKSLRNLEYLSLGFQYESDSANRKKKEFFDLLDNPKLADKTLTWVLDSIHLKINGKINQEITKNDLLETPKIEFILFPPLFYRITEFTISTDIKGFICDERAMYSARLTPKQLQLIQQATGKIYIEQIKMMFMGDYIYVPDFVIIDKK